MTDLFLDVLNTSVSAIWVVLGVILARLLLKKAPRWMVCSLWVLVALRLIFGGIEAPFSLIPSSQIIPPESLFDQAPAIDSGVAIVDNIVNPVYTESLRPVPGASVNPLQVWLAVYANLWILGMAAMALWAMFSCLRVRKQVLESIPEDGVYLCDRIASPFIFGLFRPRIYLPFDLDADSRCHVIAHEKAHIARRDHWWKPLGFALLTVNWFNPALWLAYLLLCRDIELACDEKVVQKFTAQEKKAYSAALLRCSVNTRHISACPLAFGEVGVKQRIKSVLHYKKPAFWVILLAAVVTAVLAVSLLTDPMSKPAEIRYNGVLYVQEDTASDFAPDKQQYSDTLRSVLHDSTEHPTEDNQAVRLDWEYAGQPMVLVGNALYLQEPGGGKWLKFQAKTPHKFVSETLEKELDYVVCAGGDHVDEWENLPDDRRGELNRIIKDLQTASFEPLLIEDDSDSVLSIYLYEDSLTCSLELSLREDGFWVLHFFAPELGGIQNWMLRSDSLTKWAEPYLDRVKYYDSIFSEQDTHIDYHTFERNDLALNVGRPDGWLVEEITSQDDAAAFRFQPKGQTGWITVHLFPEEVRLDIQAGNPSPAEFPSGTTGTIYSLYADRFDTLQIDTTHGALIVSSDENLDWWAEYGSTAEAILGSIRAYDKGESILGKANPLGITLGLTNITRNGATLVCTQDGALWDEIITGAPWNLERQENGQWITIMPESTVWTTEAYLLQPGSQNRWNLNWNLIIGSLTPGHYRISKNFRGERNPPFTLGLEGESAEQTCYVEFTIHPPETAQFSPQLYQALLDDWKAFEALSELEKTASSSTPGCCTRQFDSWTEVEQFVGMTIPAPLDGLDSLEKGNWAAMPAGYNSAPHYCVTFYGTRDGYIQWVMVESGYRRDEMRIGIRSRIDSQSPEHSSQTIITSDRGDDYEARTATLQRGSIQYSIRVMGDPGTGNQLSALLDELLPHFENIMA